VGGPYAAENIASLAIGGRLVVVGTLGGATATVELSALMRSRASVVGTVLRARPLEEKVRATRLFGAEVLPLLASGRVRPVVDTVFPLDRVREAHVRLDRNDSFGKLVLALTA
jgi:NADPH:quinone reductase-like Zn-dependent oxidoreductase